MDLFNQGETGTHSEMMQSSLRVGSRKEKNHVNRFQLQEQEKAQKMIGISGRKCLELSKQSARTTLLGRMCLDYLVLKGEWYLNRCALTWKAKATKSKRLYFQLVPQVHHTEGIECGLLATPQVMDIREDIRKPEERSEKANKGGCSNLREQIQGLLPTPNRSDVEGGVTQTVSQKNGRFIRTSDTTGTEYGAKLRDAVNVLLKTPGAQDAMMENMNSKGVSGTSGNLAQEAMNGMLSMRMEATTGTTGHLSHHFTLDMMAFPPNWCDISEPVLQRLEKRLKTLKRTSEKNPTTSEKNQSNVQETQ